jgi:hypothetical protein
MTARCAGATNPVTPGTASVIPPRIHVHHISPHERRAAFVLGIEQGQDIRSLSISGQLEQGLPGEQQASPMTMSRMALPNQCDGKIRSRSQIEYKSCLDYHSSRDYGSSHDDGDHGGRDRQGSGSAR